MRFKDGKSLSYYAFLMYSVSNGKSNTCIGLSRNAINKVYHYNRGRLRHRRGGKSNSNKWYLEQIVGPFDSIIEASLFRKHWTRNSRSLRGRAKKGREMAIDNKLACWDMHCTTNYSGSQHQ